MSLPTFSDFRDGDGGHICKCLGIDVSLLNDWAALRLVARAFDKEELSTAAIDLSQKLPSSEYMVLLASLTVLGLPLLADQLNHAGTWGLLDVCDDSARLAIAAAVGRFD